MATNSGVGSSGDGGGQPGGTSGSGGGTGDAGSAGTTGTGGTGSSDTKSGRGRGRSGTKSRSSRSRTSATSAASSAGSGTQARAGRSSRRKTAAKPDSPVVDISGDPVIGAADPASMTAPVADLQALDQEHLRKLTDAQRSRVIKAVVLGVIAVLFIVFVLQNARPVNVKLIFGTVTVRMIWVIVASGALGALAGFLVARPDQNLHFHLPERRGKGSAPPKGKQRKPKAS